MSPNTKEALKHIKYRRRTFLKFAFFRSSFYNADFFPAVEITELLILSLLRDILKEVDTVQSQ